MMGYLTTWTREILAEKEHLNHNDNIADLRAWCLTVKLLLQV